MFAFTNMCHALHKHYFNLVPCGWNLASCQAGMQDLDQVRDNSPLFLFLQGQEYPIHSWTSV